MFTGLKDEGTSTDSAPVVEQPTSIEQEVVEAIQEAHVDTPVEEGESVATEVVEPKAPYTPDDVKEIMASGSFDNVDTSRLSEEGQLVMRSMQAGLTPKLQEASELRKQQELLQDELRSLRETQVAQTQAVEPQSIYEHFDKDPDGTLAYIDNERRKLEGQNAEGNFTESLRQLDKLENDLVRHESKKFRDSLNYQNQMASAYTTLQQRVPGIETKQEALRDFALEYLGHTPASLAESTDLSKGGMKAVDTISRINTAYDKFNAVKVAKAKRVTPAPTKVEQPGSGFEAPVKDDHASKVARAKAGEISWMDVLSDIPLES
jgi:hypothetical protein